MISSSGGGLWRSALRRMAGDRLGMLCALIVLAYLGLLAATVSGVVAGHWDDEVAEGFRAPSLTSAAPANAALAAAVSPTAIDDYGVADPLADDLRAIDATLARQGLQARQAGPVWLPLGSDKWGHDVLQKTLKGAQTSILVGLAAAALAVFIGTVTGALAGYFGGWVDDLMNWCYSTFTAVPYLLLVLATAAVLGQRGITAIVLILGGTGWTSTYRLMRAETMKHRVRQYVLAAQAIGASHWRRLFVHILPNASHVALVQMSVLTVAFIKSEVILSFLGFGVPVGAVSWGSMLNEAQNELILGVWWQMAAASVAMAVLVTAFSLMTDALRDALDPRRG